MQAAFKFSIPKVSAILPHVCSYCQSSMTIGMLTPMRKERKKERTMKNIITRPEFWCTK